MKHGQKEALRKLASWESAKIARSKLAKVKR